MCDASDCPPLPSRLDTQGPRYTSYPTADRFTAAFGPPDLARALAARRAEARGPLSLYVHIPFCESICYYCACNKIITKQHGRAAEYLALLTQEIALYRAALGPRQQVTQLHLGGGTPTFLSDAELGGLMGALGAAFDLTGDAEVSIEVDPRTVDADRLRHLRTLGFNRLSFGVQDFDPQVQQAVHRVQTFESVQSLLQAARVLGFESTNVDLIHGLPRQTPASFERTLDQVAALRPDRIALYAYAHLPERFKPQRRIVTAELPSAEQRLQIVRAAIRRLTAEGYVSIGMDHFALEGDGLAVAKRQGRLHRNFQGYSTRSDCDLVAFGVSAIGRIGDCYAQNAKTLPEYAEALARGVFPVVRGLELTAQDRLRRDVIMALMCQGSADLAAHAAAHGIDAPDPFASEKRALAPLQSEGLVVVCDERVDVTPDGWNFVRAIGMVFDAHLQQARSTAGYSRLG